MFERLRRWRENRRLQRLAVPVEAWEAAIADWPVAARYRGEARMRLRDMALRFLLRNVFYVLYSLGICYRCARFQPFVFMSSPRTSPANHAASITYQNTK